MLKTSCFIFSLLFFLAAGAQTGNIVFSKYSTAQYKKEYYDRLVNHSIRGDLSLPLSDSTADRWEDAFSAISLIDYREEWIKPRIKLALEDAPNRSIEFQRSLLEMIYAQQFPGFNKEVNALMRSTGNAKIMAMCAEYLIQQVPSDSNIAEVAEFVYKKARDFQEEQQSSMISFGALVHLFSFVEKDKENDFPAFPSALFQSNYLKHNTVVYSIQRRNRNFPGIVIVKDTAGNFLRNTDGQLFSLPQLARSVSNMQWYLTNGNTPQGLFRMYGFDMSKSSFIGPTENIQLTMPFETSPQHFMKDSLVTDTTWEPGIYRRLLPTGLESYKPLYQTFYASAAGRTEIISHGTVVDPEYYKGQPYYPLTPTAGCLATKEIWYADGTRAISDQQKLVDAVKKAGGADGYFIVIELDDAQKPVTLIDILPFIR